MNRILVAVSAAAALGTLASAQDLLVCRHAPARVQLYSAADGALLDDALVDVDALMGLGGATNFLWDALIAPNGEIWVSNYSASAVQRFASDGSAYLGDLPTTAGASTGMLLAGNTLGIGTPVGGGGVHSYDTVTMMETILSPVGGIWDVTVLGSSWLVSYTNGMVTSLDPTTNIETPWASPGGFCEQITIAASGEVYVANFSMQGYTIHDAMGSLLQAVVPGGVGNVRGVAPLGNGSVMLCGSSGVNIYDPVTGVVTPVDTGGGAFISGGSPSTALGTNFCMANANSTGATGAISASGSAVVATNDVTLMASDLPTSSFGFFIASLSQGFVPSPAGSAGNLCLGGAIGRYVGPGEIQQSDASGTFSLSIDLTAVPQPNGFVAVQSGEDWNFQAWHRDSSAAGPTSNFTDGLEIGFL